MGFNWRDVFSIKYGALAILVLQNTFLVIFMRYSRIMSTSNSNPTVPDAPRYAASTAVVVMELVKFAICLIVVAGENTGDSTSSSSSSITTNPDYESNNQDNRDGDNKKQLNVHNSFYNLYFRLRNEVFLKPQQILLVSIPSLLYVIQNNLLYYALSHLDAATYQVGYQLKVLTTAIFSVYMLGKNLSNLQWFSLVILTFGVAMTQLSAADNKKENENTTSGFIAVLLAACTSGFAGVFFEKVLKSAGTSLWMRNIQMGLPSIVLGVVGTYVNTADRKIISEYGFFHGYNSIVWVVILLQAIGGLVVAVVVKYADNILKGFAASFSIVTSLILCYFWLDFKPTWIFFWGAILVNVSMYLYSYEPSKKMEKPGVNEDDNKSSSSNSSNSSSSGSHHDDKAPQLSFNSSSDHTMAGLPVSSGFCNMSNNSNSDNSKDV